MADRLDVIEEMIAKSSVSADHTQLMRLLLEELRHLRGETGISARLIRAVRNELQK